VKEINQFKTGVVLTVSINSTIGQDSLILSLHPPEENSLIEGQGAF